MSLERKKLQNQSERFYQFPVFRKIIAIIFVHLFKVAANQIQNMKKRNSFTNKLFTKVIPVDENSKIKLKLVIENFSWLLGDKILKLSLGMITTVLIARYLGPSDFGLLNYSIAFVSIISVISSLGLDQIIVRKLVLFPKDKHEIIGTAFFLRIVGSILLITLSILLISIIRPGDTLSLLLIVAISIGTAFQSLDVIDFWFQANLKSKYTVYAKNISFVTISILRILLIILDASIITFAIAILLENILSGLLLISTYVYSKEKLFYWRIKISKAKELLRESWPLILSSLAIMFYMRIDQIMLKELVGDKSVGIYSAAVRLAEVWYFIPMTIVNSVFPVIVETKQQDEALYYRRMAKLYAVMTWIGIVIALFTTFFSGYIIELLYGNQYAGAEEILALNIWAGIFVFQGVARGAWLINENLQKYSFYYTAGACLLNVVMNFILIPIMQGKGAAIATITSYGFSVLIIPLFIKKTRESSIQLLKSFIWR